MSLSIASKSPICQISQAVRQGIFEIVKFLKLIIIELLVIHLETLKEMNYHVSHRLPLDQNP